MIQELVVGLIVLCAAIVVLRRYAPKGLKRAARIGAVRVAKAIGWSSLAERLAQQAEAGAACGDGCGSCGNCGPSSSTQAQGGSTQSVSVESLKQTLRK